MQLSVWNTPESSVGKILELQMSVVFCLFFGVSGNTKNDS